MNFSPVGNETLILKVVMYKPHKLNISVLLPVETTTRMGNCSDMPSGGLLKWPYDVFVEEHSQVQKLAKYIYQLLRMRELTV
jgi:hypothetical protein